MKDKGIKKVFHPFRTGIDRHMAGLRRRWLRLSCRQQKVVILYLLGLCGTDKFPIEVRHLQRIAFPQTDSIQPLKNNISNDTIR